MGTSIDRYLENVPAAPREQERGPTSTIVDDYLAARPPRTDVARLELSRQHGNPGAADRAARVLTLQQRTKLPADLIDRNLDEIEAKARAADFDVERLRQTSPVVASWLAENPNHAAVAGDDIEKLSTIEHVFLALAGRTVGYAAGLRAIQGRRAGAAQAELGRWGYEAQSRGGIGRLDPSARDRIERLQRDVAREPGGMDFLDRVLYHGSSIFGQIASSSPRALLGGMVGATAGGLAGLVVGPAGAAAGFAGGFKVGLASGFAWDTFQIEGGSTYLQLSEMLDDRGEPIDEGTKQAIASGVGAVNALLETAGVAAVAAPYRTVVKKFMRESVKDAFTRPTMRAALNDFGRSYLGAIAGESGTEVAQELSTIIGEELARSGEAGELAELLEDPAKREAMIRRLASIAQQTAEGMILVGLPGASIHGGTSAYQARKASQREQFFLTLGENVAQSQTFQRLPDAMQALVERATADGPIETVYAPVETWDTYWQSAKLDPAAVAEELGVRDKWEEAHATGGDIAIPIARYATKLAPTEHNAFFAKELRTRPNEMNAREAAEFQDRIKQLAEDIQDEGAAPLQASEQVAARISEQLVAAGFDEQTSKTYAQVYETAFRTLGARTGMDPLQLFERYNLSVSAPEQAPIRPMGERVNLEDVANRAIALREREMERGGFAADEAGEAASPYGIERDQRDAGLRNEQREFVYARTAKGALRGNLQTVSTDGLIEELAVLFNERQADREIEERYSAWAESGEAAFVDALPDAERIGRSRRTTDQYGNRIKRQAEDLPDADGTMDPERLAGMRQLERDYRKAARSIEARKKAIARIEAELERRGVQNADSKLFSFIAGEDPTAFDPTAFQHGGPVITPLVRRFMALRDVELSEEASPEVRAEAARRAKEIETQARAEWNSQFERANAILREKLGDEAAEPLLYRQPSFDELLEQGLPGGDRPRGQIRFKVGDQPAVSIELLADADLSTFLHETGHFYLEVMRDLATQPNASEDIRTDYETIRTWLNAKEGQPFTRDQHEKFARGFEAYLMEGKAPSTELRSAFARFRAWLVGLYRSFENLRVFLSDDVRQVFDRLLASEDEIAAAQREQKMEPLFADPAAVGMSEAQAAAYRDAVLEARTTAENELAERLMADVRREQDQVYRAERARVREEVVEEVNQERISVAVSLLSRGTLPDGSPLPAELEAFKLSKTALVAEYESRYPNLLARLRRFFLYAKEGGVHPDQAAEILGYRSGDELLQELLEVQESPRQRIERLTDERMRADDPNLVTPAELPVEAMKAVHNEKRAQVLHLELAHLASENLPALKGLVRRVARRLPPLEEVRRQAENIIRHKRVRDINPLLYQRAEEKAARMAVDALLRGDVEAAFDEKQRELLNHELYRAAAKAREDVDRVATDFGRFSRSATRERLAKAGGDYLAQIDGILARFDFRKGISLSQLDRRRSLREWYQEQVDAGLAPVIPEKLLDEAYRTHYKELTVDELRDLHAAVQSIEHLARLKNRLLASARAREMDEARTEIIAAIGENHDLRQRPEGHAPDTLRRRLAKGAKRGLAEHTRMEFLFDFLDGFKGLGPVWQYFFKPFTDAETAENEMRANDARALRDIFAVYTNAERADWFTKRIYIPQARSSKHDGNFTKASIIAAALNWGNDYNRDALMQGYDWTLGQVEAVLAQLDGKDWLMVQRIWDHIDSYWPAIEQLEKDLNGVAPQKVESTPFSMKGVNLRGGYYPIIFDRERSTRQTSLDEKSSVQEMFGGNWARAMTRHGHTIERTNTGGKPLKLELSGLADHLGQVVHDLTHRRAVIDVYRLVSDPDIAKAIELAVGREMFLQLKPWLHGIAGDRARSYSGWMERMLGHARQGATVVGLGLKVTSAALQSLGFLITTNELGPKYAAHGLRAAFGKPRRIRSTWAFITERSAMMRDRLENYDRDVRDYARKQNAIEGSQAAWFYFIGYMDLATSIPTWLGAYRKAMDGALEGVEKGDEQLAIDYADKVVRETQAAGAAKDLASVQRGGEAWRLFTMFYSSMSILFNQFARAGQRYTIERNLPQLIGAATLLWFVPVVLEAAIRGDTPDDDESWAEHLGKRLAAYPFGTVVLLRDLTSSLDRYDYSGSPAGQIGDTLRRATLALAKTVTDEDITRTDWKAIVNTIGYAAKLPTAQLWKTLEYFYDWMTGLEIPESIISGLYRAVVTGKPRG